VVSSLPSTKASSLARKEEELQAAISGNARDWQRRAFEEFHGLVHGLVLKCLGPNAETSDLVSEIFVKFFENAHRIRAQGAIRSYLVSITMNAIRGEVRRRKRRELLLKLSGLSPEFDQEPGQDDPKAKAALIQLSRILEDLGANDRIAFVLHSLEGMQIAEIASVLKVSESTAKRRVRRANEHVLKRVSRNALLADYIQDRKALKRA
jgi:RNA polymerase sigma-70 factor (ECF subfamily)